MNRRPLILACLGFATGLPVLASITSRPAPDHAGAGPDLAAARRVALAMPSSIDYARWDEFIGLFAEDAVMFFPFSDERAVGRDAIAAVMRPIFRRNTERLPGPLFGFVPERVETAALGDGGAVVSWFMVRGTAVQRRTAVLRWHQDRWWIVLVHADNRLPPPDGQ